MHRLLQAERHATAHARLRGKMPELAERASLVCRADALWLPCSTCVAAWKQGLSTLQPSCLLCSWLPASSDQTSACFCCS